MCSLRIFTSLLFGTAAFTSLLLLALGGMVTVEAATEDGEGVEAADRWERLCFKLEKEDDGGSQIGKDRR